MSSLDEEVLLESCCLVIIRSKPKEKGKGRGFGKLNLKKRIEQEVYHNLLQEIGVNDRRSHFRLFV